ncbi:MAG TPA: DUF4097 family beta strand repeat-containing protein [Pyrinomonadaceae bacterium]|nr:DUF4097 family beta strand repeat-containing protein [Pyrinomonadaceae bacterium]
MKKFKPILNLISSKGKILTFFCAALCCLSFQEVSAQRVPTPKPKPRTESVPKAETPELPETTNTPGIVTPRPRPNPTPPKEVKKVVMNEGFAPAEKSIVVEPKVKITLCVKEGNVKINGWDRDEIRAYVEDGSQVGFKIAQTNLKSNKPEWVYVQGYDAKKTKELKPEECLSGSDIELDVPRNASVTLKSLESEIKIESVGKVWAANLGGDIYLNEIANGIEATTYRGDITVERSSGQMVLTNSEGNIIALDVSPSEIGDVFKAKTNSGRITLQAVDHRQIDTNSISGSTSFDGEILNGGQYSFSTTNGSIVLAIPPTSACKINAWFGFGAFSSDIPLQNTLKKEQSLSAQLGNTDATCSLNLKTGSGVIRIRSGKPVSKTSEKRKNLLEKNTKPVSAKKTVSLKFSKKTAYNLKTKDKTKSAKTRQ